MKQNKLAFVGSSSFKGLIHLQILILSNNHLEAVKEDTFADLLDLRVLDISSNLLGAFSLLSVPAGRSLGTVRSDIPLLCCALIKVVDCQPDILDNLYCSHFLKYSLMKMCITLQAFTVIMANLGVLVLAKSVNKNEHIMIMNMSVAQMLMGLYLTCIILIDHITAGNFNSIILLWQRHWLCQALAAIGFVSIAVSASTLLYMNLCRVYTFMSIGSKVNSKLSVKVCTVIWTSSIIYTEFILYLVHVQNLNMTKMCLPFHVRTADQVETSNYVILHQIIFIVFVTLETITITTACAFIYAIAFQSNKKFGSSKAGGKLPSMMKSLIVLAVANFLGNIPLSIIMSITLEISPENLATWCAIFVMPASSLINPIVYTVRPFLSRTLEQK